ncbi:unnamed protein product [Closterium sp. Yama58-4]|nr:unnamed protein product [Closterium sp. Yama58-4]
MLLSGDPVKAARCFQEVSRVFCDWPLLWLRLAECCILAHQQQQEDGDYYVKQQKEADHHEKQQEEQDDNQKQQGSLRSSSMTVTVMSGGRNEDTWQYVLLPAGTRGDGSEVKSETGVHAESTDRSSPVKSTARDGAGAGESTALSGLADLMARRVRGDAGASLAWVELSLLNHLACLATTQHALSLLNTRNNPPPHSANDPRTQHTSQKTFSSDRSSDPWQRSALRMYAAEALCLLGRPADALSLLSECLVEFLEASPPTAGTGSAGGASGAAAAGGAAGAAAAAAAGGKWREWRESVYVNLAALHAMKGDLAEARVCADKARGRREGGKGVAGGEEFTCAGGMALVVQAYLELREAIEGHGDEKGDQQHDRGVNAGRWEERCDAALRLLQQSNMVCFRMCSGNSMGA